MSFMIVMILFAVKKTEVQRGDMPPQGSQQEC